jgi:hypothetical protein
MTFSSPVFEKIPISQALEQPDYAIAIIPDPNRAIRFDFSIGQE